MPTAWDYGTWGSNTWGGQQPTLTGVAASGSVGSVGVLYWSLIDDNQDANWQNINNSQTAGWEIIRTE